jgi:hypothetical protein
MNLDFTTTATVRPEIHETTFSTFSKNLKGIDLKECTLYMNIDPLPSTEGREEVASVAEKYFGKVVYNMPDTPNFTRAYNWVWSNAKSEVIFNLEDDWALKREVDIIELLKEFKKNDNLYQVILRAYPYEYKKIVTSPCLMHERFYKAVGGNFDENVNSEVQLRGENFGLKLPSPEHKIPVDGKIITHPDNIIVKDIGRQWRDSRGFKRTDLKKDMIVWEKIDK